MKRVLLLLALCGAGLTGAPTHAAEPQLVADVAPGRNTAPLAIQLLAVVNGLQLFAYDDGFAGTELWRSDGTAAGTHRIADLCPGRCSWEAYSTHRLGVTASRMYFFAGDPAHGQELHVTDGSASGTRLLVDAEPGERNGIYSEWATTPAGELYFGLTIPGGGQELWRSDGSASGTRPILRQRPDGSVTEPRAIRMLGVTSAGILFAGADPAHGEEPWITDGTRRGTRLLADLRPGPESSLGYFETHATSHRGRVVFVANDGRHGFEPWVSDGTPGGTFLLRDVAAGERSSSPVLPASIGRFVYFKAWTSPAEGSTWRTDGSVAGTRPAREIFGLDPDPVELQSALQLGKRLLFRHDDGVHGPELWVSGGTPASTQMLLDLDPGTTRFFMSDLVGLGGHAYFAAHTSERVELWRTDGTPAGTKRLVAEGPGSGFSALSRLGPRLLLVHETATAPPTLWTSDGTPAGTTPFHGFAPPARSGQPTQLTPWQGRLAFVADDGKHGREVWLSDGGPGSARLLADLLPAGSGGPWDLVPLASRLLVGLRSRNGVELWGLDAAGAAARLAANGRVLAASGTSALFLDVTTELGSQGAEWVTSLWRTDGTVAGTERVTFVRRAPVRPNEIAPDLFAPAASSGAGLFFMAPQLWISDGTATGSRAIPGAPCGASGGFCYGLRASDEGAVFVHFQSLGVPATSLWTSDGTEAGTRELVRFEDRDIGDVIGLDGGRVLFVVRRFLEYDELWVSDRTVAGTVPLRDLRPGRGLAAPAELTRVGGRVFFTADDGIHGRELWASDGTPEGTVLWADVRPGPEPSLLRQLTALEGGLAFAADEGAHGLEPWYADAEASGAELLADVASGPTSSDPWAFAQLGQRLYFNAGRPGRGYELWSVELPAP